MVFLQHQCVLYEKKKSFQTLAIGSCLNAQNDSSISLNILAFHTRINLDLL